MPDPAYWMERAIEQAQAGIQAGQAPFGAVIVRGDTLLAAAHNEVWLRSDPTAHAEVLAIRRAALRAGTIDLSGCTLYSTCEPCPMCAAAIHWARLDAVCFGARIADARQAGFRELDVSIEMLYGQGRSPVRVRAGLCAERCAALLSAWAARPDHRPY